VDALRAGRLASAVAVDDPKAACWFLVTTGPAGGGAFSDAGALAAAAPLANLEHWGGCGADHLLLNTEHPDDEVPAFDVEGAAVLRYALTRRSWRPRRDVVLPVYYPGGDPRRSYRGGRRDGAALDVRGGAAAGERRLLVGFVGSIPAAGAPYALPAAASTLGYRARVVASCAHSPKRRRVVISVGINHWSTAGLGYLQTPLPRSNRTRFP